MVVVLVVVLGCCFGSLFVCLLIGLLVRWLVLQRLLRCSDARSTFVSSCPCGVVRIGIGPRLFAVSCVGLVVVWTVEVVCAGCGFGDCVCSRPRGQLVKCVSTFNRCQSEFVTIRGVFPFLNLAQDQPRRPIECSRTANQRAATVVVWSGRFNYDLQYDALPPTHFVKRISSFRQRFGATHVVPMRRVPMMTLCSTLSSAENVPRCGDPPPSAVQPASCRRKRKAAGGGVTSPAKVTRRLRARQPKMELRAPCAGGRQNSNDVVSSGLCDVFKGKRLRPGAHVEACPETDCCPYSGNFFTTVEQVNCTVSSILDPSGQHETKSMPHRPSSSSLQRVTELYHRCASRWKLTTKPPSDVDVVQTAATLIGFAQVGQILCVVRLCNTVV